MSGADEDYDCGAPSVSRTPKQSVAMWARSVLGDDASTSPRCPRYPHCGGEDGRGFFQYGEGAAIVREGPIWPKRPTPEQLKREADALAAAPRCKECRKYARAVDRLLARLEREMWP
jgi:hypothetical protein